MSGTIKGSGGRMHAIEQAASLHRLADELTNDMNNSGAHLTDAVFREVSGRIWRLRANAREIEQMVAEYDGRQGLA